MLAKIKRKFFLAKIVPSENDQPKLSENFLRLEFWALFRHFLDTFKEYLGFSLVNQLVGGLEMSIWLPDEARSAEFAIHLFAKDVPQSIHSLFDCRWGTMLCHSCNPAFRDPFDFAEDEARSAELVTQMRNPAFYIPIWLPGWGTKCRIGSGYTFFIHFFLIFSWVFPLFWSLSCLLLVGRNVITFYFLSYILF